MWHQSGSNGLRLMVVLMHCNNHMQHSSLTHFLQAPEASVKKRQAAAEALGSKGGTPSSAYLPLRLSPNGMAAVLYASCVYSLPELFGWISKPAQIWMTRFLLQGRWFPLLYGLVIFGCGLIQVGDATPKNMSSYLNAVRTECSRVSCLYLLCITTLNRGHLQQSVNLADF